MEQFTGYKTSDGKLFEDISDATRHEGELHKFKILKIKKEYIHEKLKNCIYGHVFRDPHGGRRYTNILPDRLIVEVIAQDTNLIKEIIRHLETIE